MTLTVEPIQPALGQRRLGASKPRHGERLIAGLLGLCALVSVATTVGIVVALFVPTIEFFRSVSVGEFLTTTEWAPLFDRARFGVLPLAAATLVTTVCALAVCVPLASARRST